MVLSKLKMHAFLTTDNDTWQLIEREKVANQIPFILQKIDDVRELKKILKFKFNQKTAILINKIDEATEEALNAFLKILEEPNENIIYILNAKNIDNVLPTIVSRCEVVPTPNTKPQTLNKSQIERFLNSTTEQKIAIVEKLKDRDDAIHFVEDLILVERENKNYQHIDVYLQTLKNLKQNGNIGLQVLNLVGRMNS